MSAPQTDLLALRSPNLCDDRCAPLSVGPPWQAGEGGPFVAHTSSGSVVLVTCSKEVWQHFLETVLLEEKVTILLSAQKHERQQCRLDEAVHTEPPSWVFSGCL